MSDCSEDIIRPNSNNINDNNRYYTGFNQKIQTHQYHSTPSWMDMPLPPYPIIPPYCPNLFPYTPFFFPPPSLPLIYSHSFPYLKSIDSTPTESCLIDLSIPKNNQI